MVQVAPRTGRGENAEGGVARITAVGAQGYDVKFVVGQGRGLAVNSSLLSAVADDATVEALHPLVSRWEGPD